MSKEDQQRIYSFFEQLPILYSAGLADFLGSVEAAMLLGQIIYWQGLGAKKDWIYKTIAEMQTETGLTRTKQSTAIKICVDKGFLVVERKGIPAKRHFRVDLRELNTSLQEYCKLDRRKDPDTKAGNQHTITKITQKNTSKNTTIVDQKSLVKAKTALVKKLGVRND